MDKQIENQVLTYLKSQSRNKIVLYKGIHFDFTPIDLGLLLAQSIYNQNTDIKLSMLVTLELEKIFNANTFKHDLFGNILAISNIGILFEPDLKQDIIRIIEKYSFNNVLFVKWDGEIDNENLYFLTKQNGEKISIKNLSFITL